MNPFIGVALFLVLAALQSSLAHVLAPLPGARPHIVVLAAISCGLLYGPRSGALWGTIGGFALDLASAAPVGANTLPLAIVGFLGGFGEYAAFRVNRLLPLQAAFAGAIVFDLLHMILLQLSGWDFNVIVAIGSDQPPGNARRLRSVLVVATALADSARDRMVGGIPSVR